MLGRELEMGRWSALIAPSMIASSHKARSVALFRTTACRRYLM